MYTRTIRTLSTGMLLLAAVPVAAQVPLSPSALGMGGAYIGMARGHEALFVNPANLALSHTPQWSVGFPQLGASATVLGLKIKDLPDFLNLDELSPERRDQLLSSIPAAGTNVQYDFRAPLFSLQIGHFALGAGYGSIGEHTISRDIVELLVEGYEDGRTEYTVGNTQGSRMTYWDFAAGYGKRFGPLSLGATGHYIRGGTIVHSRLFDPQVQVSERDVTLNYVSVNAPGTGGYSLDLGAAIEPMPGVTLSAALRNAVSDMNWSKEKSARDFTLHRSDIDDEGIEEIRARYNRSEQPVDPATSSARVIETASNLYDGGAFPATANVGLDWSPIGGTHIGVAYRDQLTDGELAARWDKMASLGIQQKLPLITVRAGMASNLDSGSLVSAGLTLGPIKLGVAKVTNGTIDGASQSGWIGTFGLGVRTPTDLVPGR